MGDLIEESEPLNLNVELFPNNSSSAKKEVEEKKSSSSSFGGDFD